MGAIGSNGITIFIGKNMSNLHEEALKSKAWPFDEARKVLKRLKGKLPEKGYVLFAEPTTQHDLTFNRSVVLIAEQNETGTIGFIINKIYYCKKALKISPWLVESSNILFKGIIKQELYAIKSFIIKYEYL